MVGKRDSGGGRPFFVGETVWFRTNSVNWDLHCTPWASSRPTVHDCVDDHARSEVEVGLKHIFVHFALSTFSHHAA